jgi:prepilin-type N-terminal cleavage/methylation domain-containing protein
MHRQRGFTLVEVLVALLILAIVMTTTLAVFLERNRRLQQANEMILAYQALANETEIQRRTDFTSLNTGPFSSDTAILAPLAPFVATVTVTDKPPDTKDVMLTIIWKNGLRKASLELSRVNTGGSNLW